MSLNTKFEPDKSEWVSFEDEEEDRTWLLDVTFLTSAWNCIYSRGCKGVLKEDATELMHGCCSYGAHFVDQADADRILEISKKLSVDDWQFKQAADKANGPIKWAKNSKGSITTKLKDGACIFLNRSDFHLGAGCALHQLALQDNISPMEYKPEVCWQLPLRKEDLTEASGHIISKITSWKRRDWGKGGYEFHWWCTEDEIAYSAKNPVYITLKDELIALIGQDVFDKFTKYIKKSNSKATVKYLPMPSKQRDIT